MARASLRISATGEKIHAINERLQQEPEAPEGRDHTALRVLQLLPHASVVKDSVDSTRSQWLAAVTINQISIVPLAASVSTSKKVPN